MPETRTGRRDYLGQLRKRLEKGGDEFMKGWKAQARRPDRLGDATYRGLELVHDGLGVAARSLSRLERATQLPHRTARPPAPNATLAAGPPANAVPAPHGRRPERHEPEPTAS